MWNKYCRKEPPTVVHFRGGSHVWRQMLNAREEVEHEIEVAELRQGETWDDQLLDQTFNEEIAEHIRLNVHYEGSERYWDKPYWMPTPSGKFSVSSAWQILRHRRQKIAIDGMWRRQGEMVMSTCWRCQHPQEESIEHIFVTSPTASKCCPKLKTLFQAVPDIITWELWKRRNVGKHGGSMSTNRVIHEINRTLHQLERVRVTWQLPCHDWYKCNTDGASKGNPGPSSLGFCVRDVEGDVVYARAVDLGVITNVVAEAKDILQGLEYCVEHDFHLLILETDSLVMKKVHLSFIHSLNFLVQGGG
ncbi:uncharacterized protein LOC142171757 [Nicotiana tabacum]|uniref:Uncharacterized protein LOC142171757 n=1 Tax=Nicotiana tabacum TaxID=4097 RepID=A0AC58T2V4_TOBAC